MPVTGLIAQGASSAIGTTMGTVQALAGYFGQKKTLKNLERLQAPNYEKSKSISDYYNQALNRYQQSPTESNLYKMQAQNIARGTAQGLSALQDRKAGLAGIPSLVQGQNDALLKAGVASEQDQNQKFGQLGNAANAMAGEDRMAFNINKMAPYERKYTQLSQKAAAQGQMFSAGLQNMAGGISGAGASAAGLSNMTKPSQETDYYDTDRNLRPSTYKVPLAKYK
jgi:hypothetical protein